MDDNSLVARTLAGDNEAFASLVQTHQNRVFGLAYRMLGRREDAEDAAQETFLRAYRQLTTFRTERSFSTWLLSICAHHCVDLLRRRKIDWLPLEEAPEAPALAAPDRSPEETVLARERSAQVLGLLKALPPKYRVVTVLYYMHDLSISEIAKATHSSGGAVKTQLFRARDMLAAEVQRTKSAQEPRQGEASERSALVAGEKRLGVMANGM